MPGERLVDGFNRVEAFLVDGTSNDLRLERLRTVRMGTPPRQPPTGTYALSWDAHGRPDGVIYRPQIDMPATWERIEIARRDTDLIGFLDGSMVGRDPEVNGWATDLRHSDELVEIVAFLEGRHVWSGTTGLPRPDVAERHGTGHSRSGFVVSPAHSRPNLTDALDEAPQRWSDKRGSSSTPSPAAAPRPGCASRIVRSHEGSGAERPFQSAMDASCRSSPWGGISTAQSTC